ncbi:DUF814 domain-containing protein [Patescibacteria group bacterium]|nr:DUF814 domain-containing protein [Patescibacteria group bacterium]
MDIKKFRNFTLSSGAEIFLGKNADNNDKLVSYFKGKPNVIIHTIAPGSPFCVIEKLNPNREEIKEASIICASKSQNWRDHHSNVDLHVFTGKDVKKTLFAKKGTWKVKKKAEIVQIKKEDILKFESKTKKK